MCMYYYLAAVPSRDSLVFDDILISGGGRLTFHTRCAVPLLPDSTSRGKGHFVPRLLEFRVAASVYTRLRVVGLWEERH